MVILLLIIALLLDGIISLLTPTNSYLIPLITVTTLYMIYPLYKKKDKNYFIATIITGLTYDLLYTNLLFFNTILFYCLGRLAKYLHKNFNQNFVKTIIYVTITIIAYELLTSVVLLVYRIVPITLSKVIFKISHSLVINIIYASILYAILKRHYQKN